MRRRLSLLACALALATLAGSSCARADVFDSIELVSQGFLPSLGPERAEQAGYAHDPAISGNGRYVAFDGSFAGLTGVWRRDLETGEVEPVAVGKPVPGTSGKQCEPTRAGALSACNAELPSISENGQFVSFTTTAPLAPHEDTNSAPDVYVRNMDSEASETPSEACSQAEAADAEELEDVCAFTLVSAADASDQGLTYKGEAGQGSVAAGRTAISADGQEVAFVTTAISDLTNPQEPQAPDTPAMQVAVRYLRTRQTLLVSARYDPATGEAVPDEPVSGVLGAVYGAGNSAPRFPVATGGYALTEPIGASISADGSAVAWLGVDVSEQVKTLPAETLDPEYTLPLWRRIGEGATVPSRRVTGGGDPENPACAASGETHAGGTSLADPCQGPFAPGGERPAQEGTWTGGAEDDSVPQLSADGDTVAFVANAVPVALGTDFGKSQGKSELYAVDMSPGLTRTQAVRALTEPAGAGQGGGAEAIATTGPIVDFAISQSGRQVAFTTKRTIFALPTPTFVSPTAPIPGMVELFYADLEDETLTRVTEGYEGAPSAHPHKEAISSEDPYPAPGDGALSPSLSADGDTIAFSSTASNLVYGDGNTPTEPVGGPFDGADAYVVHREQFPPDPVPQSASPAPPNPEPAPAWTLGVSAQSLPNGTVRLYVRAPGPGTLVAAAQGWVLVHRAHSASSRRGAHRSGRSARGAAAASLERTLATAHASAAGGEGELLTLTLALPPGYRPLALRPGGLSTSIEVSFAAADRPTLHQSLVATFLHSGASSHAAARGRTSAKRRRGRAR